MRSIAIFPMRVTKPYRRAVCVVTSPLSRAYTPVASSHSLNAIGFGVPVGRCDVLA